MSKSDLLLALPLVLNAQYSSKNTILSRTGQHCYASEVVFSLEKLFTLLFLQVFEKIHSSNGIVFLSVYEHYTSE